jgi:hypothetical protein
MMNPHRPARMIRFRSLRRDKFRLWFCFFGATSYLIRLRRIIQLKPTSKKIQLQAHPPEADSNLP